MSTVVKDRNGTVAILAALSLTTLVGVVGIGVDLVRLWLVQSRLQASVDAGVLVAAREMGGDTATNNARALFWADFGRVDRDKGIGFLGAIVSQAPSVTAVDADTVRMSADAVVPMTLMNVVGVTSKPVHAEASAKRSLMGMELALVLDVTGSMKGTGISALRASAENLINILYGSSNTRPNLWVSVVPYSATVNLGSGHKDWLAPGTLVDAAFGGKGWAGCVEARDKQQDATDSPPKDERFNPYLWKSTLGVYKKGKDPVTGDNDWPGKDGITEDKQDTLENAAVGPNIGCPVLPVLPLTASKSTIRDTISKLKPTFRGGTLTNVGLQAGWFTLSPRWRGLWGDKDLPLPMPTPNMRKVLVMMTDGENQWFDWDGGAPGLAPKPYDGPQVDADYTAYGRLSEKRLGDTITNNNLAKQEINSRVAKLCEKIKENGITIYTITFGVGDTSAQQLWRNCASKPDNYFNSPNQASLSSAFQQIGTQLASLRLTQ